MTTEEQPITQLRFGTSTIAIPSDSDHTEVTSLKFHADYVTLKKEQMYDTAAAWVQEHVNAYHDQSWKAPTHRLGVMTDPHQLANDVEGTASYLQLQSENGLYDQNWRDVLSLAARSTSHLATQMKLDADNAHLRAATFRSTTASNQAGNKARSNRCCPWPFARR